MVSRLRAALARPGHPSSDYDLNPDFTQPPGRRLRPAAVLVAVSVAGPVPRMILTRRSPALRHHPGQIAFPGGKVDAADHNVASTALREAREEVGLPNDLVEILDVLPTHETVTGFNVSPVVALVHDAFEILPEPGEVDEVLFPPLSCVTDPRRFSVHSRLWQGKRRYYYAVPWGAYYIWGATARILRALGDQLQA